MATHEMREFSELHGKLADREAANEEVLQANDIRGILQLQLAEEDQL